MPAEKTHIRMIRWWHNPTEQLPLHREQVLVRYDDKFELAIYDSEQGVFKLRNSTSIFSKEDNIEWMELLRAEGL